MSITTPPPAIGSRPPRCLSLAPENVMVMAVSLFLRREVRLVGLDPRRDAVHAR